MATKKIKSNDSSTIEVLKKKARDFNEVALKTSSEIVDETLATGEQWQNIFAKALKKGTILFGKQQDLTLTGLEMMKGHFEYGSKRFRKLLTLKPIDSKTPKRAIKKTKASAKTDKSIDEVMKAATKAEKVVKKTVKPGPAKRASTVKTPKNRAAATTQKAIPVKAVNKTKLTIVEGIGPKIEELLKKAGFTNLDKLADANPADLKEVLVKAGTRFQLHDPSTWSAQAKLAAAGKMDELIVLQTELKGGK